MSFLIVDNDGKLMVSYKYDSYGNIKQISGDLSLGKLNPFRYKGYYYDNESGMYYCKSRYYVAYWRRWLNMDRIEYLDNTNIGNINLFSYCNNNPIMMIDDKGNMPKWAKKIS
ncbi:MAG: RHS repeat-associated core domain-containing protein [Clostridium sp.]|nr:MAG: RHS repeat-associated core domain-containing protein [Clostridium sp.]